MLGIDSCKWIDVQTVLSKLRELMPEVSWCRVSDTELPDALAQWDAENNSIKIRESIYRAANYPTQNGRARWSIFHEVIHAVEGHEGILNRALSRHSIPRYAKRLNNIESYTDRLTAAFIAPKKIHFNLHDC